MVFNGHLNLHAYTTMINDKSEHVNQTAMCASEMKYNVYDNFRHSNEGMALTKYKNES